MRIQKAIKKKLPTPGKTKRAVSMVSGLKSQDYNEQLMELKMPTLTQRREELELTEMYKIVSEKSAVDPNTWFEKANGIECPYT